MNLNSLFTVAEFLANQQQQQIRCAVEQVSRRLRQESAEANSLVNLLLSGSGTLLARTVIGSFPAGTFLPSLLLSEMFHQPVSAAACWLFAVARLAHDRCRDDLLEVDASRCDDRTSVARFRCRGFALDRGPSHQDLRFMFPPDVSLDIPEPDSDAPPIPPGGIVTVGNFDGVHRGHQRMLQTLREVAVVQKTHSVVVTFHPHPITVLRPNAVLHRLTTPDRRAELLRLYGADHVVILPVTAELLQRSPEVFFDSVLVNQLQAGGVVEGPNFHFGKDRAGDIPLLRQLAKTRKTYLRSSRRSMTPTKSISSSAFETC